MLLWLCKLTLAGLRLLQVPCVRERQKDVNLLFLRNDVLAVAVLYAPVLTGNVKGDLNC